MSSSKPKDDSSVDIEQQFILRMPEDAARYLAEDIDLGVSFKDNFTLELKENHRRCIVRYNGQVYQGRVMDLPCIIESQKTTDGKNFYKTASISQMIICTQGDNGTAPIRGSAAYVPSKDSQSHPQPAVNDKDPRLYQYLHGITPPLKNALRRRFRKTRKKQSVDITQIEKEVKNMLKNDLRADEVTWEISWVDASEAAKQSSAITGAPTGTGDDAGTEGAYDNEMKTSGSSPNLESGLTDDKAHVTEVNELFGAVSSSSSEDSENEDDANDFEADIDKVYDPADEPGGHSEAVRPILSDTSPNPDAGGSDNDGEVGIDIREEGGVGDDQMKTALLLSDSESSAGDDESDDYHGLHNPLSPQEIAERYQRHLQQHETNDDATAEATAEIEVLNEASRQGFNDVELGDVDDEDDDFVPAGGELLADDESVALYQHHNLTSADFHDVMIPQIDEDEED